MIAAAAFRSPRLAALLLAGAIWARPLPAQLSVDSTFTPAERAGLEVGPDSIWHPLLGFALPHPGPAFVRDSLLDRMLEQQLSGQPAIASWALRVPDRPEVFILTAAKLPTSTEAAFRGFAVGLRGAIQNATPDSENLEWKDDAGDYRLAMRFTTGSSFFLRCVSRTRAWGSLVVCAQSIGDAASLRDTVQAGLRVGGGPR